MLMQQQTDAAGPRGLAQLPELFRRDFDDRSSLPSQPFDQHLADNGGEESLADDDGVDLALKIHCSHQGSRPFDPGQAGRLSEAGVG